MKLHFMGLAADIAAKKQIFHHVFRHGRKKDCSELESFLSTVYEGDTVLCKNGRSALTIALKSYFKPGDKIIINGFTCFAVFEAVKAAGMKPVFVDIELATLNFDLTKLKKAIKTSGAKGIIIQNTLGNPINIDEVEQLANKNGLKIIEDLAHGVRLNYPDGRRVGTVGVATVFSFGKEKTIDAVSGGAVVLREEPTNIVPRPFRRAKISDSLRERFYPLFGAIAQGLTHIHAGGFFVKFLVKIHWIEKSADNRLDIEREIGRFEARLALEQFCNQDHLPIRASFLVNNRAELLDELKKHGFYLDGFWYEKPVAPARYYKKVHFPENECKNAVFASEHIINLPKYILKDPAVVEKLFNLIVPYMIEKK